MLIGQNHHRHPARETYQIPSPNISLCAVGSEWKNQTAKTGSPKGNRSRSAALLHEEEPAVAVRAFGQDASWVHPRGGVSDISVWEETAVTFTFVIWPGNTLVSSWKILLLKFQSQTRMSEDKQKHDWTHHINYVMAHKLNCFHTRTYLLKLTYVSPTLSSEHRGKDSYNLLFEWTPLS